MTPYQEDIKRVENIDFNAFKKKEMNKEKLRNKSEKICSQCKKILPLTEFYKDNTRKDGIRPNCIECAKQITKKGKKTQINEMDQLRADIEKYNLTDEQIIKVVRRND